MSKHSTEETEPIAMTCPFCGTDERKLAECSSCGVWYCAGECYSLHKRPTKAVVR